jgi:hypothetical protein
VCKWSGANINSDKAGLVRPKTDQLSARWFLRAECSRFNGADTEIRDFAAPQACPGTRGFGSRRSRVTNAGDTSSRGDFGTSVPHAKGLAQPHAALLSVSNFHLSEYIAIRRRLVHHGASERG